MSVEFQALSNAVYSSKYQLTDKDGNKVDKDRFDTFRRVAKALAQFEKDPAYWEPEFYKALCYGAVPAGRITSNAGAGEHKPNTSLINCIVSDTIYDSISGIGQAVKDSLISLSTGSGIGYCFSTLRPKGSYVSGVGAKTSGPLPFADIFDKGCFTIASAGGRRGAQMATFDVRHPDIIDFIKVKREDGRFRQFNISALIPNEFFNEEKTWQFRFPLRQTDPFTDPSKTMWDYWHVNDEHYTKNEEGLTLFKKYGEIDKEELWNLILKSNYDFAEPGILFIDKINRENNLWFCEDIVATNPSMPAGTLVSTSLGVLPIEELENKSFSVKSLDGLWAPAECRLSGENESLLELSFGNLKTIQCTPQHRWPVFENGSLVKKFAKDLKAGDLIPLNRCESLELNIDSSFTEDEGFLVGVFMGNGWLSERSNGNYAFGITFNKLDIDLAKRTLDILNSCKNVPSSVKENACELTIQASSTAFVEWFMHRFGIFPGIKNIPLVLYKSNDAFIRGFIDGLFSTDGHFGKNKTIFKTKSKLFAQNIMKLLAFHGIKCNGYKHVSDKITFPNGKSYDKTYTCYSVEFSRFSTIRFASLFSLTSSRKQKNLDDLISVPIKKFNITQGFNVVESITPVSGFCKVWDISVYHDQHVFPTEWGYTGNCGEQPLPPSGACLLGSIDLTRFVSDPFTDAAKFNYDLFTIVVETFTRMLDNVVELNNLPLPAQQEEIYRKRRHGMGFFGLGSTLTMLGIPYNSKQALEFGEDIAIRMALTGFVTGVELAQEKGPAPIMNESFVITPEMARLNNFAKQHLGETFTGKELFLQSDYMQRLIRLKPSLEDTVLMHGCRFTHHSSIAPTGTISLAMGNGASGGVEPSFAHQYFRNVTTEGKKTRQQESVYSKEFLVYKNLPINQGKSDEELLADLPDYFVTADSIHWKAHVDMLAAIQPWVDSSISKTINLPSDISFDEFKDVYQYAYSVGCKAVSTYRYNPETLGSILSRTSDLEKSRYEFTLDDGTVIKCKGNDQITYDGESTTAENLFNALKEKTYGKF